jgi:hypothetical protein
VSTRPSEARTSRTRFVSPPNFSVDDLRGPGGLGGRVVVAAAQQLGERAGAQDTHEGHSHDGDDEYQPGAADRQFGYAFKHACSP